jgi:hypothetical protein
MMGIEHTARLGKDLFFSCIFSGCFNNPIIAPRCGCKRTSDPEDVGIAVTPQTTIQ